MSESTKRKRPAMTKGLEAGMKSEDSALDERFRRAEAYLGGSGLMAPPSVPAPVAKTAGHNIRAQRHTFSMTNEDIILIEKLIARVIVDAGVRLNKSEVLRLALIALESTETRTLKSLTIALNRLNKRT